MFNAEQIDGLPGHYYALAEAPKSMSQRLDHAEAFFTATGIDTRHGGNKAFYSPSQDFIQRPPYASFENREYYYAKLAPPMERFTPQCTRAASTGRSIGSGSAITATRWRNW